MNPSVLQDIDLVQQYLSQASEVGILLGSHQNLDTYAASLALSLALSASGKQVQIVSPKDATVEVSNLVGVQNVQRSFAGSTTKLVVSLPYTKGEVAKVLFTEAPNTINFHLTAAEGRTITQFDPKDVRLNWEGGAPSLVITIGVSTAEELALTVDPATTKVINIDNFPQNERFGDVVLGGPSFSSLSELVAKIIASLQLPMDRDSAQNILDGVLFATRNFTKPDTSPFAFEAVSAAMYQGAQRRAEAPAPRRDQQSREDRRAQMPPREPREQRDQRDNREQRSNNRQDRNQRVNENDFPALHMQPRANQRPQEDRRRDQQPREDRRAQMPPREPREQRDQRDRNPMDARPQRPMPQHQSMPQQQQPMQQPVAQPQSRQDEIMDELQAQPYSHTPSYEPLPPVDDNYMVPQPQVNMPSQMPDNEDIPDDWLMPKVFKSSKNNN